MVKELLEHNYSQNIRKETKKTKSIFELFKYTNNQFSSLLIKTIQGYKGLITNFSSTAQQLSGPVKIVEIGAQLSEQGRNRNFFICCINFYKFSSIKFSSSTLT